MHTNYVVDDRVARVELRKAKEPGWFDVSVDGEVRRVELVHFDRGRVLLRVDGRQVRADVAMEGDRRLVKLEGGPPLEFEVGDSVEMTKHRSDGALLAATMHSQVVSVEVGVGDRVSEGATLVVLEAMKMETRLTAPHDGVVTAVACGAGDVVEPGVALVELEEAGG